MSRRLLKAVKKHQKKAVFTAFFYFLAGRYVTVLAIIELTCKVRAGETDERRNT